MKKIILISLILLAGCVKPELPLPVPTVTYVFDVKESKVTNGQDIYFKLPSVGTYTLTLIDKESGQVLSRERFIGKVGENIKRIYTNSIESQYLYLVLEDVTKTEIGKTTLIK